MPNIKVVQPGTGDNRKRWYVGIALRRQANAATESEVNCARPRALRAQPPDSGSAHATHAVFRNSTPAQERDELSLTDEFEVAKRRKEARDE